MNWFKLVGATDSRVDDDWEHKEPENFNKIYFPWNKPPKEVCSFDRIILYAVGDGVLMAIQTVDGTPSIVPRRGPIGSPQYRWPHSIEVLTHCYCSPLSTAPKLREIAPDFAAKYSKRFRNGSHWRIEDEEYEQLAEAVTEVGFRYGMDSD